METQAALATFYRRWHGLERSFGARGGLVIDFDLAPRALAARDLPPYDSRERALDALEETQAAVSGATGLANPTFVEAKLAGANAYLRALMGERAPFDRYLRATMGIDAIPADPDALAESRAGLESELGAQNIPWGPKASEAFHARFGLREFGGFEAELRGHAARLVAAVRALVPSAPEPTYTIAVVSEDAYWANWIDGSVEDGVTLKVNTHPRVSYTRTSPLQLAAHEIAGHAVHVGTLQQGASAEVRTVDPGALALAVHSCEAFQMEGLAQAMIHLLLGDDLPPEVALLERYRGYQGAVVNQAQLRVEAGEPIDRVCAETIAACPLTRPVSIRSDLRDRARDPLYRSYIAVYAPSRRMFLRAMALPTAARTAFLRDALRGLWTPHQLDEKLVAAGA